MKLLKKLVISVVVLTMLLAVVAVGAFAYGVPRSWLGVATFKLGFHAIPFTHSYLEFYSPLRRDVGAGTIPSDVDAFLCERLEKTDDIDEFDAIVNFYTIQAGGREGGLIWKTSPATREKIIDRIMANLAEPGADYRLEHQLVLVEQIRLGESLGKAGIGSRERGQSLEVMSIARAAYIDWWSSGRTWEEKQQTDPLAGSIARVTSCC